jgi:hypothetical protein
VFPSYATGKYHKKHKIALVQICVNPFNQCAAIGSQRSHHTPFHVKLNSSLVKNIGRKPKKNSQKLSNIVLNPDAGSGT